ncbi:MAG: NAD(P)H-hydrate dehydratase [Thermoprotei archaeon]
MKTITVSEMRALEDNSAALGISGFLLMENAGAAVARLVHERKPDSSVTVFAGKGGKAGDAYVAARHLSTLRHHVTVICVEESSGGREDVSRHFETLQNLNTVRICSLQEHVDPTDVVVDGMLGTGFRPPLVEPYSGAVAKFNETKAWKVSIDIPTGYVADQAARPANAVKPDVVVTMHARKKCLEALDPGVEVVVADIGIPLEASLFVGPGDVAAKVPRRAPLSKKGDAGRVLVVAGSEEYTGAAILTCSGAFRAGADLVYLMSTGSTVAAARTILPELICLKYEGQSFSASAAEKAVKMLSKCDAVAVGPGLTYSDDVTAGVRILLEYASKAGKPVIVDADAIRSASDLLKAGRLPENEYIFTPHANEFKALTGSLPSLDLFERIKSVLDFARKTGFTILLKGYCDIVASAHQVRLSASGVPAVAVAGTGDVLTGVTAALKAKGLTPTDSAAVAVYALGLAGLAEYASIGEHLVASDMLKHLPSALTNPMRYATAYKGRRLYSTGASIQWEKVLDLMQR